MKKPYLTYALSAEGKLVHIDSVANGKELSLIHIWDSIKETGAVHRTTEEYRRKLWKDAQEKEEEVPAILFCGTMNSTGFLDTIRCV